MTQITAEIQSLSPTALIELFVLHMPDDSIVRFHGGTNALQQPVVWQGETYVPMPIEAEGFDMTTQGALPRPKIRIANIDGLLSASVRENDDLVGCKVERKRTFARFLDAINFPGGVNSGADPNQHLVDDLWFVERKMTENRYFIEWELSSAFDVQGVQLPYRQVIQNACTWRYRGPECGYTGDPYDKDDKPCAADKDFCAKRLVSCEARFGTGNIPFGGFPGAVRYGV